MWNGIDYNLDVGPHGSSDVVGDDLGSTTGHFLCFVDCSSSCALGWLLVMKLGLSDFLLPQGGVMTLVALCRPDQGHQTVETPPQR